MTFCYCYVANCHRRRRRLDQCCARVRVNTQIDTNANDTNKRTNNQCRDGLEKMEREKLRQAERDREMKERDEKRRQEKLIEQNLLMKLNANESSPKLPAKSKFVCNSLSHSILILYFFSFFVLFDTYSLFKFISISHNFLFRYITLPPQPEFPYQNQNENKQKKIINNLLKIQNQNELHQTNYLITG